MNNELWCESGHLNEDQHNYINSLILRHDPVYVLETGFCTGRSAYSVLLNGKNIKKFMTIDINFDYNKFGRDMLSKFKNYYNNFYYIEGNSSTILTQKFLDKEFENGIDWFTVDGDHSYEGCLTDLENVYNHINKNGIIIIDDYKSGPPNGCHIPQVTKACDEFHLRHPTLAKNVWNVNGKGICLFRVL